MKKEKLLYVSPVWPCKTGISEYSESLLTGLVNYFDVTLLTDGYKPTSKRILDIVRCVTNIKQIVVGEYVYIIYNFGNQPYFHGYMYEMLEKYPGYVILHDFILYYLTVGVYQERNMLYSKIYELEGSFGINIVKRSLKHNKEKNLLAHKNISASLPMNKEVLRRAKGIFVHSIYSADMVKNQCPDQKVFAIPIVRQAEEIYPKEKFDYIRQKYNIEPETPIIGSFGLIAESKQNEIICKAVRQYNRTHDKKVVYVMCGEGSYVDNYLGKDIYKTGFLENRDFFQALLSCNLIMNLRYPYNGEASETLVQAMYCQKVCLVTDVGWFGELPDNVVIKVPIDVTEETLCNIIDRECFGNENEIAIRARAYVEQNCNADSVAERIYSLLSGL